eukprot:g1153.t1
MDTLKKVWIERKDVRSIMVCISDRKLDKERRLAAVDAAIELTEDNQKSRDVQIDFVKNGAIDAIVALCRECPRDGAVRVRGTHFIRNICRAEKIWHEPVKKNEVLSFLLKEGAKHIASNVKVKEWTLRVLINLTFCDELVVKMIDMNVIVLLCDTLKSGKIDADLTYAACFLAVNLSFDGRGRKVLVDHGIVECALKVIKDLPNEPKTGGKCLFMLFSVLHCSRGVEVIGNLHVPRNVISALERLCLPHERWCDEFDTCVQRGLNFLGKCVADKAKLNEYNKTALRTGLPPLLMKVAKKAITERKMGRCRCIKTVVKLCETMDRTITAFKAHLPPAMTGFGDDGVVMMSYMILETMRKSEMYDAKPNLVKNVTLLLNKVLGS